LAATIQPPSTDFEDPEILKSPARHLGKRVEGPPVRGWGFIRLSSISFLRHGQEQFLESSRLAIG
jgi:hypothetical protein